MQYFKGMHNDPPRQQEKRRFHRIKMILGLACHRSSESSINIFTDDVSLAGIRFFAHQPLKNKEDVTIDIPVGQDTTLKLAGRVAWISEKAPNSFEGGVEFHVLGEEELRAWKKFIIRNSIQGEEIEL